MSKGIVRIEFHTDNAAFEDYREMEIANILLYIANMVLSYKLTEGVIRYFDGNTIGTWTTNGTNE